MATRVDEVLIQGADQECPNCHGHAWWVAILADRLRQEATADVAFVDLEPAPMARCARCGLSARLDADEIPWEP